MPPRSNRKAPTPTTRRFQERNLAERFVSKRKQFRRVAARHDKLLPNYEGLVQLAAVATLLRQGHHYGRRPIFQNGQ